MNPGLKKRRVKLRFKEEIEPQEILLDKLAQKKEEELGISEKKIEVPFTKKTWQIFLAVFLILILILFARTFQFQVIEKKKFKALAEENKFIFHSLQASRGVIYDRTGKQLVFNEPSFDLVLNIKNLPQKEAEKLQFLKEVSLITKRNLEELKIKIEKSELPQVLIVIAENLDHQTLIRLEAKIAELPGFQIERTWNRDYQGGENFSHLIGYTGKVTAQELKAEPGEYQYSIFDWLGRDGLESSYEEVLRKRPGKLRLERDALGNIISQETISLPESGQSLVLWLDFELQKKIKEELKKQLQLIGSQAGAAVALDPKTGGILALVSLPDFDNNLFQKGTDPEALRELLTDAKKPLFNRAIAGQYPTGSTIKPLIASAVLEEKLISPEKEIYDPGFIEVPHRYDPAIVYTFLDWKAHGWTDLRKAIAESCNVYFYTVGGGYGEQEGLGPTRIKKYLSFFGWGERTKVDLPGEAKGLVPDPVWKEEKKSEGWWDGDTYLLSIGQGDILATPLQVAASFSAVANNGVLYQPQAVQKIVDKEKNIIEEIKPKIIRENFIDSKNLQIVREGMREAVTYGSSLLLSDLPVKAAAKTGTAQTARENFFHHWVTVFAPYEDPQIVLTILIENVRGLQAATLPVAKAILEWYFTSYSTPEVE